MGFRIAKGFVPVFFLPLALAAPSLWGLSADANQTFDVGLLPQWTVAGDATAAVTQVQCDSFAGPTVCPDTDPSNQGRYTCTGCDGTQVLTLLYEDPSPVAPPPFLGIDVYSVGIDRTVGIQVESSGGVTSSFSTSTRCGPGGNPPSDPVVNQNVWDTLYIDLSSFGGSDIRFVRMQFSGLGSGEAIYFDYLRDLASPPSCDTPTPTPTPTTNPCAPATCTPTLTPTPTETPTFVADACASAPGTPTCTPTLTGTPTHTFTPTFTPTPTPPPLLVYPNPVDLSGDDHDNLCAQAGVQGSCVKFRGIHKDSTVTIYTLAFAKVRTFTPEDIERFKVNDTALNPFPDLRTFVWEGDNDDRNPVAAGLYFYKIEGPVEVIGKLAIKRSRSGR